MKVKNKEVKNKKPFGFTKEYNEIKHKFTHWMWFFENSVYPEYIQWYKDYYCDVTDRALIMKELKQEEWFSNLFYPLITSIQDAFHSASYDSVSKINAVAQAQEDEKYKELAQSWINWAIWSRENKKTLKQVDRVTELLGDGFCEIYYKEYLETVYKVKDGVSIPKTRKICGVNVDYVDEMNFIYNPFASNWYEWEKFVRNLMKISEVKEKFSLFFDPMTEEDSENGVLIKGITDEDWKNIIENPIRRSNKDYSLIRWLQYSMKASAVPLNPKRIVSNLPWLNQSLPSYNVNNTFDADFKNKVIECIKYFDQDQMAIILNGWMVYLGPNPFWFIPFYKGSFGDIPWVINQKGIAFKLRTLQRQVNGFLNRWIDMINWMANPLILMDKDIFGDQTPSALTLDRYKTYPRMQGKSYEVMKIVDPQAVNTLQDGLNWAINQAYEIVGLNSYSMGWEGKVERVGWAPQIKSAIIKSRLLAFQDNKNDMLSHLADGAMQLLQDYLPDDYKIRLTGEDSKEDWGVLDKETLSGRFLFEFDNTSLKTLEDLEKRSEMQQSIPIISDPVNKYILETEYLKTLGIRPVTEEERMKIIKEQIDMEVYKQGLIEQAKAAAQQPNAPAPQEPVVPSPEQVEPAPSVDQPLPWEGPDEYFARTWIAQPRL